MSTEYKVWIQVERCNPEKDVFENVTEPHDVATFSGRGAKTRAIELMNKLEDIASIIEPKTT